MRRPRSRCGHALWPDALCEALDGGERHVVRYDLSGRLTSATAERSRSESLRPVSVLMRAVMREWHTPSFEEAASFVAGRSPFRLKSLADGWADFEAVDAAGETVLAGDLWIGAKAREELAELEEFLDDHDGDDAAREAVRLHLQTAVAVVGMQVLMSRYDDSVAAANAIIEYLEQRPGVLTQVDTVGWYDGAELVLRDEE